MKDPSLFCGQSNARNTIEIVKIHTCVDESFLSPLHVWCEETFIMDSVPNFSETVLLK